tara:strand:- start:129 stop:443 length:315 start_codon:yes stop_codon:yes gene_type:complete
MKKTFLFVVIIILIVTTTLTKNSTIKLENKIFSTKENIGILKDEYELIRLDYNYLTNPKKLLNYQSEYFENDLSKIDINKIKQLTINNEKIFIKDFKIINNEQR